MPSIALMMIVRNEGKHLMQCLLSAAPHVDHIFIGLGGTSTDDTEDVINAFKEHSPVPVETLPFEWADDFAAARNYVLDEVVSRGFDWAFWLDGDDTLIEGEQLRKAVSGYPDCAGFLVRYDYWEDELGNVVSSLVRERLFNLKFGWHWRNRIHEICEPSMEGERIYLNNACYVKHHGQDKERDYDRNIRMLEAEENPTGVELSYLGREYAMRGDHDRAVETFQRALTQELVPDEQYYVLHAMADSLRVIEAYDEAAAADFTCTQLKPDWPDAYYGLAETQFKRGDWIGTLTWTRTGEQFGRPNTSLVVNPLDYTVHPAQIAAIANINLGNLEEALRYLLKAQAIAPTGALEIQIRAIRDQIKDREVFNAFMLIQENLRRNDEWLKARHIFRYMPKSVEHQPEAMKAYNEVLKSTAHVDNPQLMVDHYVNNPGWKPMDEEVVWSEGWQQHPRVAYAIETAKRVNAETVLDAGCSDGFIALPVAQRVSSVNVIHGLDLDPRCVAVASQRGEKLLDKRVEFFQGGFELVGDWAECPDFYKYNLGIFFEAIEHVVDPMATLDILDKACEHVAITTPYLAWENGNVAEWNKVELKGHLRIFDMPDIEMLLQGRGTIHNLYVQPWGETQGWIFADYDVGPVPGRNVEIVCPPSLEPWGPTKLKTQGLGGSETAAIRLAEELSAFDTLVTVYNDLDNPGYFNKVRYRHVDTYAPAVRTDLSIAWRYPELADNRPNTARFVLWMHDTDAGDRLTPERAEQFDNIVVLSEWHRRYFLLKYPFVSPDKLVVIGNGVDRSRFDWIDWQAEARAPKVIYSSSPDRGLDVILEHIWPRVIEEVPDAELHYFYGWNNFEALARYPQLRAFRKKIVDLEKNTKNVFSHGRVPQGELAKYMQDGSIWLYPTYFHETYCITAIEAQLSGLVPVTNDLAALAETVKSGVVFPAKAHKMMGMSLMDDYAAAVIDLLRNPPSWAKRMEIATKAPASGWDQIAKRWATHFLD